MIPAKRVPVVTLLLLAANMFAAFALFFSPDLRYDFGFRSDHPSLQSAFTSLFLHANLVHLLGNMVFLAAVGAAVELATGSIRFAVVYFASGIVGVALHYAMSRHSGEATPYIGASGCIAGCAAYYSVRYTAFRVPVAPKVAASVLVVTVIWLALQVVGAFVTLGESSGTAFWAHLGGFATGAFLSLVFRAPDLGQARLGHEVLEQMNLRGPSAVAEAARRHLKRHPDDKTALEELARALAMLDDKSGEADALLQLIATSPEAETPAYLGRLVELGMGDRIASHRRLVLAEKLKQEHPQVARMLLKSVIEGPANDSQRPEALLALVGLERESSPERANVLLSELLVSYPLHPCADLARKRGWAS